MNETFNFSAISLNQSAYGYTNWETVIQGMCNQWRGYSTNAHDFYIVLVGILIILRILRVYFPQLNHEFNFKSDQSSDTPIKLSWNFKVLDELIEITTGIIVIRIIQVWYIINFVLGGVK